MESGNSLHSWFFDALANALAAAFEALAGDKPAIQWEHRDASVVRKASGEPKDELRFLQRFHGVPGAVWAAAATPDWTTSSQQILRAAGLEDSDTATIRSTFFEWFGRSMAGLAGHLTRFCGREVACESGQEVTDGNMDPPPEETRPIQWAVMSLTFQGSNPVEISVGADLDLLGAIAPASGAAPVVPKTLDLLLDVELPVSVSFGRAQIALKDVLKLTTGSILELDRTIAEPVEIIVNNCAIARGEVVVVEGNFGVRVLRVISRQERLKTLS